MKSAVGSVRKRVRELGWAVGLFTRLPLPTTEPPSESAFAGCVWAFPLAGIIVGLTGAIAYLIAYFIGLPPLIAALMAVVATVAVTGGLHEDGLADFWDGVGGGATVERKLTIMHDPRVGSFGALALLLAVASRWAALTSLEDVVVVVVGLVAAHTASRACLIPIFFILNPVREDGLGATAGRPKRGTAIVGLGLATALVFAALPPLSAACALAAAFGAALLITWITKRQLGGYTGDVFGCAEQMAEIAFLFALVATV